MTSSESRTSSWLNSHNFQNGIKDDPEDLDTPLDFSKKKRQSSIDEDSLSDGGSSASSSGKRRRRSPPVSMADMTSFNRNMFPFPPAFFPSLAPTGLPAFPFANMSEARPGKNTKPVRPFKAYPREPLQMPMANLWMMDPLKAGLMGGDMLSQFKRAAEAAAAGRGSNPKMARGRRKAARADESTVPASDASSTPQATPVKQDSPISIESPKEQQNILSESNRSNHQMENALNDSDRSGSKSPESKEGKDKRAKSVSDDQKDAAYWERRRKNNEAAKRSRDSRRAKEDELALRAAFLEQANLQYRIEIEALKLDNAKLRSMLALG